MEHFSGSAVMSTARPVWCSLKPGRALCASGLRPLRTVHGFPSLVRAGIARMKMDGTEQIQLTFDEYNNWFAHPSPDNKWIAFLSFPNTIDPTDHPFYKRVMLRLMPVSGGAPKVIAYLYGGQGTINTPSWSPDSKYIAFVSNSGPINK